MTRRSLRTRVSERLRHAARAVRGVRLPVLLLALLPVVVGIAGAIALSSGLLGVDAPNVKRVSSSPPVRLDALPPPGSGGEATDDTPSEAKAPPVIGVGTDEFAAQATDAPVDVDGAGSSEDAPSDAEIKRQLDALERENARIEAALRDGGPANGTGELIWPVRGPVTSKFGQRWGRLHAGIDIGVPSGTPVRAADSGRVVVSGAVGGYGNYICIQHTRSLSSCYAHNSSLGVRKGESVRKGEVIARSGCTGHCFGDHVHFEVRVNGRPVDPLRYL